MLAEPNPIRCNWVATGSSLGHIASSCICDKGRLRQANDGMRTLGVQPRLALDAEERLSRARG